MQPMTCVRVLTIGILGCARGGGALPLAESRNRTLFSRFGRLGNRLDPINNRKGKNVVQ